MPQEALGRTRDFPHDGDATIGNEAAVFVSWFKPYFSALIDRECDLASGTDPWDEIVSFSVKKLSSTDPRRRSGT